VGFIGLGVMGRPMAGHLLAAGFPLTVHSRSRGPVDETVALGAVDGRSNAGVGRASDVVILMVPDPPDVEAVTFGADGLASGLGPGSVIVDMSTGDPLLARRWSATLAKQGIDFLDAPVSGGMEAARAGNLSVMVGGRAEALERARPALEAVSGRIVHVGDSGAGQIVKAANQLVVGSTIQAVAEALVLATAAGVDPVRVREALLGGYAASRILEVHGQRMIEGNFTPGARAVLYKKDLGIIQGLARSLGVPTPAFDAVAQGFERLVAEGGGERDYSALVTLLEEAAGVSVAGAAAKEEKP
jgi:2-hydroxy-3-oxopropionate reductase